MRTLVLAAIIAAVPASGFAQTHRAYVNGTGGFATTPDGMSGELSGEAGVKVAPHLYASGDIGQYRNLQPSGLQPAVDSTHFSHVNADTPLHAQGLAFGVGYRF